MTGRERGGEPVGLYLHIPFCRSKCPFCDFCSFPRPDAAMVEAYVDELIRRIRLSGAAEAAAAGGVQALDTVYIGGGTPTLLTPSQAARLMEAVHAAFFVLPDAEVTVEGNPAALTAEGLAAFRAGGVNRLSLGVQSANADELRALGRLHSFPDAVRAVETARAVGIGNISLDFMIGIPGQTPDSLRRTLEAALALEPEHLFGILPESGAGDAVRAARTRRTGTACRRGRGGGAGIGSVRAVGASAVGCRIRALRNLQLCPSRYALPSQSAYVAGQALYRAWRGRVLLPARRPLRAVT